MLSKDVLKYSSKQSDFLSPKLINVNYKRLDTSYQRKVECNMIDERLFLTSRVSTISPSKFTPFEKKKNHGLKENKGGKSFASHKVLDYDVSNLTEVQSPIKTSNANRNLVIFEIILEVPIKFHLSINQQSTFDLHSFKNCERNRKIYQWKDQKP